MKVNSILHSPDEFCKEIQGQVENGRGILPLVGAGLSARSGIPTRWELIRYLQLCIGKALGLGGTDQPDGEHWQPRHDSWPLMRDDWVEQAEKVDKRLYDVVNSLKVPGKYGQCWHFQEVCRQAYGALTDWRLALQFLSRISREPHLSETRAVGPQFSANPLYDLVNTIEPAMSMLMSDEFLSSVQLLAKGTLPLDSLGFLPPSDDDKLSAALDFITKKGESMASLFGDASNRRRIVQELKHAKSRTKELSALAEKLNSIIPLSPHVALGDIDNHVIDYFFNHIVAGRLPSMEHRMIAHFTHALRSRVVLTLNFDDLLEQAFREIGLEPAVFDVHNKAGMPPWSLLGSQQALIKLHGGRYGLRADFTLDKEPTPSDYSHFYGYLTGGEVHETHLSEGRSNPIIRHHLLVAGVSGDDLRIRLLVRGALTKFPELKVFWCCYSHRDAEDLSNHFNEHIKSKQIVAVRSNHLGLLFWEVYQRVTRCLPPGGLEFPTIWNIPTPPRLLSEKSDSTNKEVFSELETCLNKWLEQTRSGEGVPGFVLESDSPPDKARSQLRWGGLTPLCWRLFQDWSRQNNRCIWMDAEDIANTEELKIRILQAVSCQCGRSHESPSVNIEGCDDSNLLFLEELEELVQSSGKQWIIFLNLRGFLGYSADPFIRLTLPEEKVHQAGESFAQWMKNRSSNWPPEWSQNQEQKTQELIQQIANRFRSRIASVILCHKGSSLDFRSFGNFVFAPSHDITSSSERELSNVPSDTKILFLKRSFKHNSETQNWAAERAKDAIDWMKTKGCTIDEQRSRARLLRALTMSQGVRHQNAIVSRSVMQFDRTPDEWWQKADDWLRWLVSKRIVRQKPGGFLWMDWEVQEHLRYLLLEKGETLGHEAHKNRDSLHQGLADWYMTFFHATRDPLAVFHAVYHRCRVAQLSLESGDHVQARGALCEANNHLEAARANVLSRGHYIDTKKCLEGYQACLCKIVEDETEQWKVACQSKNEEKRDVHERNLRFLMMVKIKAHLYRIWFYRDVGKPDKVIEACKTFWTWRSQWSNPDLTSDSKEHLSDLYVGYWGEEDFISRAWTKLEEAIVCMSLRSYQEAEDRLTKIAENECKFPHSRDVLRLQLNEDPVPIINKWVEQRGPKVLGGDDFRYSERRLLVHVLRRMMEIRLRRSETLLALQDYGYAVADAQLENWLQEAQNLYLAAQMLPRYVSEEERGRLGVEHSRLHSVMAGVFALKGDLWGTYRQISEAGVALAELSESEESIARVVIDLRRIYCYIARLRGLTQFKKFCQSKTRGTKDDFLNREALSKEIVTAEAILNDIKQILDAVEHRMARSRKSLWWWMTMCRYRMVLLEYTGIIHTWDKSEIEIPKDIIDAAKYWMNSACRRGTFDAFQLAYIAHSYSNLIKVYRLQLHKRDDTKTDSEWQKRLRDLSYRIDDIQTRRPSTLEFQAEANIQTYIDCVLQDLRC